MMKKIKKAINTPSEVAWFILKKTSPLWKSDSAYLKAAFMIKKHQRLNLDNPQTFCEKLNWLKINYHNELMPTMVDKYEAKKYVGDIIGHEHIIKTLGVYDKFEDIDFDSLPDRFVLKCTHDSGSYVIVGNKDNMNKCKAEKRLSTSLVRNYYYPCREWPYKNLHPRIIAEEMLINQGGRTLTDYKFFCFNGEPFMMYISNDIADHATTDFFDMNGQHLDLRFKDPNSSEPPAIPEQFEEMKRYARLLSKGLPHVRVDFYIANGTVYFGEMTFFHNGGFFPITPEEWDLKLGKLIKLPV